MKPFRLALTGDFLNESGQPAYGDPGLSLLDGRDDFAVHFLLDQAPRPDDASYWSNLYAMEVTPKHIAGVDGLIVLRPRVSRMTFAEGAIDLAVIGRSGAGYDKVDLAACTENDVVVFNVPDALDHSTASTALMYMLALAKRLKEQEQVTRQARWDRQADVMGSEIRGRTLGIIGLGRSGRELARLIAPFAVRLIAYSPHAEPAEAEALGVELTTLDRVMAESDFVSIHARLSEENHGLIDVRALSLMKPTAYLINVARGALLDQAALTDALRARRIAGAALDVFEIEPLPPDDPLIGLDNVILTPHWSASTADVWQRTGEATVGGMLRVARGEPPENVVNPEVLKNSGFRTKLARLADDRG